MTDGLQQERIAEVERAMPTRSRIALVVLALGVVITPFWLLATFLALVRLAAWIGGKLDDEPSSG